jgi:antitoxin component YwqK of YwqJK toxin-antitoxin module
MNLYNKKLIIFYIVIQKDLIDIKMLGFTYLEYLIYSVEVEVDNIKPESDDVINKDTATYKTNNFKVIEIEDIHGNKMDDVNLKYKKNETYSDELFVYLQKEIAVCIKINDMLKYSQLSVNHYCSESTQIIYKNMINKHFTDIINFGVSGYLISYYDNGQIDEKYFHNNLEKEGEYIKYHRNGKIAESGNYINGKKNGKHTKYFDSGKVKEWNEFKNGDMVFDWRFLTHVYVSKGQSISHLDCD